MDRLVQILFYVGAFQGILLSVFLFTLKKNRISNKLLGLLTFFWGLVLLQFVVQEEDFYKDYPHALNVIPQLLFAFFPLFYLHVKYLLLKYRSFHLLDLLHFLPVLISILLHWDFYLLSGEEKLQITNDPTPYYHALQIFLNEALALQGIIYSVLSLRLIARYHREVKKYQSNIDRTILTVLFLGAALSLISWIIGTIGINLEFLGVELKTDLFVFVYLIFVVIIYIISYFALTTPEIFKVEEVRHRHLLIYPGSEGNRLKDSISIAPDKSSVEPVVGEKSKPAPELVRLNNQLEEFMQREKPYLNPELSLQELSDSIEVTRHQLSSIINQVHGMNFYEYVNQYRVEEVKRLMEDPDNRNLKLISIAYDAGFNSKASFNRIFKQKTGMTPSQYFEHKLSA